MQRADIHGKRTQEGVGATPQHLSVITPLSFMLAGLVEPAWQNGGSNKVIVPRRPHKAGRRSGPNARNRSLVVDTRRGCVKARVERGEAPMWIAHKAEQPAVVCEVLTRDRSRVIDDARGRPQASRRVERYDRSICPPHKAVRAIVGVLVTPCDGAFCVDAGRTGDGRRNASGPVERNQLSIGATNKSVAHKRIIRVLVSAVTAPPALMLPGSVAGLPGKSNVVKFSLGSRTYPCWPPESVYTPVIAPSSLMLRANVKELPGTSKVEVVPPGSRTNPCFGA